MSEWVNRVKGGGELCSMHKDNRNEKCFNDPTQIKGVLPAPTLSGRSARIRYSFPMDSLNSLMTE